MGVDLSHIGGKTKVRGVYKHGVERSLQASIHVLLQHLPARRGGADYGFRKLNSSNLHVSATCGHECSSEISSPRSSVFTNFSILNSVTEAN